MTFIAEKKSINVTFPAKQALRVFKSALCCYLVTQLNLRYANRELLSYVVKLAIC